MIATVIARLKALSLRQWLLIAIVAAIVGLPTSYYVARWVWRTFFRPPVEQPMLPYGELRVGIDASYPPFGVDLGGELIGLDVDLAQAVAEEMGVPLRFINMGYDGLYDSLRADQADALFSALRVDPLRMNDARYTTPYFNAGQVLVRRPESGIDRMQDMEGHTIAIEFGTEGDLTARTWQRRLRELTVRSYDVAAAALDAVLAGEADAALVDAISARLWLNEHDGLAAAPDFVTSDPYAVAVQVGNVKLWEALNTALTTLIENGTVEDIIDRWM